MNQLIDEGLSAQEIAKDERDHQRMFDGQNAWSNEEEIAEILSHPLDIRTEPVLRDPALVDLQPFRDAVHADRIAQEEAAIQRKHERMRELFGEQMYAAPTQDTHDPERIKSMSSAERTLTRLANGETIEPAAVLTAAEIGRLPMTEYHEFMEQQVRRARGRVALQPTRKTPEEHAREVHQIIDARIGELKHDIRIETDIDTRLRMVYELKEASEVLCGA